MNLESRERREIPAEVLFHGTTQERFRRFITPEGSYQDPEGGPLWLDESTAYPLDLAHDYQKEHGSDAVLVIVRSDMLSLQVPRNAERRPGNISQLRYWTTDRLPPGSFVHYNVTQDPVGLFNNTTVDKHMTGMAKLCEPLGVLPSYVAAFTKK
jgi:hypothetical protein